LRKYLREINRFQKANVYMMKFQGLFPLNFLQKGKQIEGERVVWKKTQYQTQTHAVIEETKYLPYKRKNIIKTVIDRLITLLALMAS
jgi:hypothetical protein